MYENKIRKVLQRVREGDASIDEAMQLFEKLPYEDLGFAKVDHHRVLRKGFPEVIYCKEKQADHALEIIKRVAAEHDVLATRASNEIYISVRKVFKHAKYHELCGIISIKKNPCEVKKSNPKKILIISAGTSDIPIAEEASVTAEFMGNSIDRLYDVGIAGIHRLLGNKEKIDEANVIIVVAGMDGALPAVVSGLSAQPVIAVPTSVGYGACFNGLAPLLTMLNSCSPGVVTVNIDNGFGAGFFASLINK